MLDYFLILTTGGVALYDRSFNPAQTPAARSASVNALISHLLVAGTGTASETFLHGSTALRAHVNHTRGLVLVAASPKTIPAEYAPELLARMERVVLKLVDGGDVPTFGLAEGDRAALDAAFLQVLDACENGAGRKAPPAAAVHDDGDEDDDEHRTRGGGRRGGRKSRGNKKGGDDGSPASGRGTKPGKAARKWDGSSLSQSEAAALDFSSAPPPPSSDSASVAHLVDAASLGSTGRDGSYTPQDLVAAASSTPTSAETAAPSFLSSMKNLFSGNRALTESDLAPVLASMETHLISKNVAAEVARDLLASVGASLVGQRIGWTSVGTHLRRAMEDRLHRVLLPSASTDLLRDIQDRRRAGGGPYVAVFCGVNGVGKSTNLAKITFWLLRNRLKVLIAACDTFRSGAVEQLRTHVRNLRILTQQQLGADAGEPTIELFERGYGKDAAGIARDAIAHAKSRGFDVVLVDTAGRMQDNEPLMRSLAKLMALNQPDKVIFVGEALVGNESVDQLTKFNAAIRDFSSQAVPRDIDAMVMTKFDVIADKVGAAVSMTFITRRPILFVGTGQTYTDLKRINVAAIVEALLAP
ncbi:hypothetical protein H9P43_009751 [Blastocladiella emersonii ATCC 22665]|nr:hypothetical protein H9P43_009751 [Blastocladiella emersonii ATCC 22665]